MKNTIAILGAAAVLMLANSAGWADSLTDRSGTISFGENTVNVNDNPIISDHEVGTGYEVNVLPSNIVAMERPTTTTRNVNHFTGRPASGKQ